MFAYCDRTCPNIDTRDRIFKRGWFDSPVTDLNQSWMWNNFEFGNRGCESNVDDTRIKIWQSCVEIKRGWYSKFNLAAVGGRQTGWSSKPNLAAAAKLWKNCTKLVCYVLSSLSEFSAIFHVPVMSHARKSVILVRGCVTGCLPITNSSLANWICLIQSRCLPNFIWKRVFL